MIQKSMPVLSMVKGKARGGARKPLQEMETPPRRRRKECSLVQRLIINVKKPID
jgi:hypothetical protein